jgi:peptide deformylase
MGDPALQQPAVAVGDFYDPRIRRVIQDMWDTVLEAQGAGIAAPQIGHPHRIILFGVSTPRYADREEMPTTVLINPEVTVLDATCEEGWEPRAKRIAYRGYDPDGNLIDREASGFHARVVQHECDHLDGILFPQRMKDFTHFGFEEELGFSELVRGTVQSDKQQSTEDKETV